MATSGGSGGVGPLAGGQRFRRIMSAARAADEEARRDELDDDLDAAIAVAALQMVARVRQACRPNERHVFLTVMRMHRARRISTDVLEEIVRALLGDERHRALWTRFQFFLPGQRQQRRRMLLLGRAREGGGEEWRGV
jgi:hypothetical protein